MRPCSGWKSDDGSMFLRDIRKHLVGLQGVASQKSVIFIVTPVKTTDPTQICCWIELYKNVWSSGHFCSIQSSSFITGCWTMDCSAETSDYFKDCGHTVRGAQTLVLWLKFLWRFLYEYISMTLCVVLLYVARGRVTSRSPIQLYEMIKWFTVSKLIENWKSLHSTTSVH
jgi:hypothetical protein